MNEAKEIIGSIITLTMIFGLAFILLSIGCPC